MAARTVSLPSRGSIADLERYARQQIAQDGGVVLTGDRRSQQRQLDKLARRLDDSTMQIWRRYRPGWYCLIVVPPGVWLSRGTLELARGNY